MGNNRKKNGGFTLAEMVIAIAIMITLSGIIGLSVIKYIEHARKSRLLSEAKDIYDQCAYAVKNFDHATYNGREVTITHGMNKRDEEGNQCGRISNLSCYNEAGAKSLSNVKHDYAFVDQYIAKSVVAMLTDFSQNDYGSQSPNGKTIAKLDTEAAHKGKYNFQIIYDKRGCRYVELYHRGYYIKYEGPNTSLDDVISTKGHENEIKFTNVTN